MAEWWFGYKSITIGPFLQKWPQFWPRKTSHHRLTWIQYPKVFSCKSSFTGTGMVLEAGSWRAIIYFVDSTYVINVRELAICCNISLSVAGSLCWLGTACLLDSIEIVFEKSICISTLLYLWCTVSMFTSFLYRIKSLVVDLSLDSNRQLSFCRITIISCTDVLQGSTCECNVSNYHLLFLISWIVPRRRVHCTLKGTLMYQYHQEIHTIAHVGLAIVGRFCVAFWWLWVVLRRIMKDAMAPWENL